MRTYQLAKLERALQIAAEESYSDEVVDTEMEEFIIGEDGEFYDKQEWIDSRIESWLERAEQEWK